MTKITYYPWYEGSEKFKKRKKNLTKKNEIHHMWVFDRSKETTQSRTSVGIVPPPTMGYDRLQIK